jgi:uncharacterized protein (DUF1501 family)
MTLRFSRRDFLRSSLVLGGSAMLFGSSSPLVGLAHAQSATPAEQLRDDRYYVFCYFSGGWDVLLGLDPREPAVFNNGSLSATGIQPAYELLPAADQNLVHVDVGGRPRVFGPYIGELASPGLVERLAVVRGLSMDTLTHEVGRRRWLTGKQPSGLSARGSSAGTWMASALGAGEPVPNLVVGAETYNVDQPTYASALKVATGNDLLRALRPSGPTLSPMVQRQIDDHLASQAACNVARKSRTWTNAELARSATADMLARRLDALFDFTASTPDILALRTRYNMNIGQGLGTPEAQAAMAAQALIGGVSRAVTIEVAGGLDTHFQNWATQQGPAQRRGFTAIARLARHLQETEFYTGDGSSWLDHTVIVGFSEFSRTPMLNASSGRDHHLTNSCFLLGGPVQGVDVGASSDQGMLPQPIDLATGTPVPDGVGELVKPDHVLQTLYNDVGLGLRPDLRVPGIPALLRS